MARFVSIKQNTVQYDLFVDMRTKLIVNIANSRNEGWSPAVPEFIYSEPSYICRGGRTPEGISVMGTTLI